MDVDSDVVRSHRGSCPVCGWEGALRVDGSVRTHDDGTGGFCDGCGRTDPLHARWVECRSRKHTMRTVLA